MAHDKIQVIGIGDDGADGLAEPARSAIKNADVLIGTGRCLTAIEAVGGAKGGASQQIATSGNLDEIVSAIEAHAGKSTVVLTTGDPLFYGVARYLCDALGKERFRKSFLM